MDDQKRNDEKEERNDRHIWQIQEQMSFTERFRIKAIPMSYAGRSPDKHMNTDYTATRMLGYLYQVTHPRVDDVIDEMLAILSDREAIIQKKELEHAQATINSVYRDGL